MALSLFGVTAADTYGPGLNHPRTEEQWRKSEARPHDWEDNFWTLDPEVSDAEIIVWWMGLDGEGDTFPVDVTDDQDRLLRCLKFIARPLICVAQELMPEAVFTPNGSGGEAVEAEQWGASLAADAAKFRSRRV